MKPGDRFEYEGVTYELQPNMIQILTGESNCKGCELATRNWKDCPESGLPNCGDHYEPADQQFLFKRVPDPVDPRQLNLFPSENQDETSKESTMRR